MRRTARYCGTSSHGRGVNVKADTSQSKINSRNECLSSQAIDGVGYTHALLTALADISIAVVAVDFVWHLDLDKRAKWTAGSLLAFGSM